MNDEIEKLKFSHLMALATTQEREFVIEPMIMGLNACLPENILKNIIAIDKENAQITIENTVLNLKDYSNILILGGGKATALMCVELIKILNGILPIKGSINIPKGQEIPDVMKDPKFPVYVYFSSHPIPDEDGVKGVETMFTLLRESSERTLVFILISGGGSALMTYPLPSLELSDLKEMNKILLKCGADITEINTIRKHLDGFKGGRLARAIFPRTAFGLILSDVIGDPLEIIASGPTVPDPSTFSDVVKIIKKYSLADKIPKRISEFIAAGISNKIVETPKPEDPCFKTITNLLIGSSKLAEQTFEGYFEAKNIPSSRIDNMMGEAIEYGKALARKVFGFQLLKDSDNNKVFYSSGEFTVTLKGKGVGGRNQEMLLGFLIQECDFIIKQDANYVKFAEEYSYCLIAGAFDGLEGNSPAMGAIIDSSTIGNIKELIKKESIEEVSRYLTELANNNNSYELFSKLNASLVVGYTGTNVNDCLILYIDKN
jgi:glycerate 2-kinase